MTNNTNPHLTSSYDDVADVLYIRSGTIVATKNSEAEEGLVLRYDARTHSPIGATVIDYKEYWLPRRKTLVKKLARFFEIESNEAEKALPR
jgi:hypothetical protein